MTTIAPLAVPRIPFSTVAHRIARFTDPFERGVHHTIIGPTGSGKSHLVREGLLKIWPHARTLVIDAKDDGTWSQGFAPVTELPDAFGGDGDGPAGMRYRLVVDRSDAKRQVRRALEIVRQQGHVILVVDELRSLVDREQMGLSSTLENISQEGRGLGITLIAGCQSTAWIPSAAKDQPAVVWIGRQRNAKQARALAEIVGYGRELDRVIQTGIPTRNWLYSDSWDDSGAMCITGLS